MVQMIFLAMSPHAAMEMHKSLKCGINSDCFLRQASIGLTPGPKIAASVLCKAAKRKPGGVRPSEVTQWKGKGVKGRSLEKLREQKERGERLANGLQGLLSDGQAEMLEMLSAGSPDAAENQDVAAEDGKVDGDRGGRRTSVVEKVSYSGVQPCFSADLEPLLG